MSSVFRNAERREHAKGVFIVLFIKSTSLSSNQGRELGYFHLRTFQGERILRLSVNIEGSLISSMCKSELLPFSLLFLVSILI